jgi:hypothetical protein
LVSKEYVIISYRDQRMRKNTKSGI